MSIQKIQTIPLPSEKMYWNYYLKQMRALSSSFKTGSSIQTRDTDGSISSVQVSADIVFDNFSRPSQISEEAWRAANKAVYMGMLLGCPMSLRHIYSGVTPDNRRGMIDKLKSQIGPKQVQIERFTADVLKNVLVDKSHYFSWFDILHDLFA